MRRRTLVLWVVGALFLVLSCSGVLLFLRDFLLGRSRSIFEARAQSREILLRMDIACPPNTGMIDRPHGAVGWMMFCESDGVNEGPWLVAKPEGLRVRGQYCGGKECGTWEYYDEIGDVRKTIEHGPE